MDQPEFTGGAQPESPAPRQEPPRKNGDDKLSRTLLIIGLALVGGAILVYQFSPEFKPNAPTVTSVSDDGSGGPIIPIPVPEIRGKPAPAFELPDVNGKMVRLGDFKGKILLVNFWATWCNPCLTEIPWFIEFKEKYGDQGFDVVAINIHESDKTAVMPFIVKNNMRSLTVLIAPPETDQEFGGFPGLPVTFLVDRDGKYYSKHLGLVDKMDVEDEILSLLNESPAENQPAAETSAPQG